jgi:hypothetical protein
MMVKRRSIVDGSEAVDKYDIQDSDEAGAAGKGGGADKLQCFGRQQQHQ